MLHFDEKIDKVGKVELWPNMKEINLTIYILRENLKFDQTLKDYLTPYYTF